MSDQIETAVEAVAESRSISIPPSVAIGVMSLATYGGVDLTRKALGKVKQIRANRNAKKVVETPVETPAPVA